MFSDFDKFTAQSSRWISLSSWKFGLVAPCSFQLLKSILYFYFEQFLITPSNFSILPLKIQFVGFADRGYDEIAFHDDLKAS